MRLGGLRRLGGGLVEVGGWPGGVDRETFRMVASALQRLARVDRESYFTLGKSSSRTEPPLTGYKSRIHNHARWRLYKLTVSAICSVHC